MKTVTNISSSIIPMEKFPTKRWFTSSGDSLWYYHAPRGKVDLPTSSDFTSSLDPFVKPLVDFLHLRRVKTTPSCSGHSHDEDHFLKVWFKLARDAQSIKSKGLVLTDVENNRTFLFRDRDYQIPWRSFHDFFSDISKDQKRGYLGFWISDPHIKRNLRNILTDPSSTSSSFLEDKQNPDASLFSLTVIASDEGERKEEWSRWTEFIKDAFVGIF